MVTYLIFFHSYDLKQINENPTYLTYDIALKIFKANKGFSYLQKNITHFKYILANEKKTIIFGADIFQIATELNYHNNILTIPNLHIDE